jgi:hypothetical protein
MVMRTPYARTRGSQQPQSQHGVVVVFVVVVLDIVDLMELPVVVERSLVMFLGKGTIQAPKQKPRSRVQVLMIL